MKKITKICLPVVAGLTTLGVVTPLITACRKTNETKHSMTFNGTNCTAKGVEETYVEGADVEFTITPSQGYTLPEKANVTVTGVDSWDYVITDGVATFTCKMGTSNISVTVLATAITHIMTFNGTNCTAEGVEETYAEGANVEFTITPNDGYTLPEAIQVTGVVNYEYSIDAQTGIATFTCVMGTVNIVVSVNAGLIRTVTFNGTGCAAEGVEETYVEGDDVKFTIKPDEHYTLPETIQVTGVVNYEYSKDAQTGIATFTCVMGKNDISVTVAAISISHKMDFRGTKCIAEGIEETYDEGDDVKITIKPDEHYTLPETIQVTGVVNYEYSKDAQTGNATFICVMGKNDISVTVVATAITHFMTFSGDHCTAEGVKEKYAEGANVEFTITPNDDYTLPETIQVTGVVDYVYSRDAQTGNATFTCTMCTSDISVSVTAGLTRTVTFNGTGCTSDAKSSYAEGTRVEIIITPDEGYILPKVIEIEGIKGGHEYHIKDDGTAILTFTVGADNITITVVATQP